jgi:hypothetical protein
MKKTSLSLLVAGVMALAGAAQAETFVDTTVLGAAPATVAGPVIVTPFYIVPDGYTPHVTEQSRQQAAATFNVPARAGEASTMTGGAPNMVTDNNAMVAGTYSQAPYQGPVVIYGN